MMRRYLVVDDNLDFADNLREILAERGAEVDVASCGEEGLARVRTKRYDAIVTDMRMPGMDGAQMLNRLRTVDPGVPTVLLSAFSQDELLRRAKREGLLAVISKGTPPAQLLALLSCARRDGAVVLLEADAAFAEELATALSSRGLSAVIVASMDELSQVAARPFVVFVDEPQEEALARVHERWPDVPTVVSATDRHLEVAELVRRIEAHYREHAS